jgi:hypothetical protein
VIIRVTLEFGGDATNLASEEMAFGGDGRTRLKQTSRKSNISVLNGLNDKTVSKTDIYIGFP